MASPFGNNPFASNPFGKSQPGSTTASTFGQQHQSVFGISGSSVAAPNPFASSTASSGFERGSGPSGSSSSVFFKQDTGNTFGSGFSGTGSGMFRSTAVTSPFAQSQPSQQSVNTDLRQVSGQEEMNNGLVGNQNSSSVFGQTPSSSLFGNASSASISNPSSTPFAFSRSSNTQSTIVSPFAQASTSSIFGQPTTIPSFGQAASPFGQTTSAPSFGMGSSLFAQTTSAPSFGQGSSPFGQTTSAPSFGQVSSPFGQTTSAPSFGQASSSFGLTTSAPSFGQASSPFGQNTSAPSFGQASSPFGQTTSAPSFGQASSSFGQTTSAPSFGQASSSFGQTTSAPSFGQASSPFGQTTSAPSFGQASLPFGQNTSAPSFGQASLPFGQTTSAPSFGQASSSFGQASSSFGQTTSAPSFGQESSSFGQTTSAPSFSQGPSLFGQTTSASSFGQESSPFGQTASASSFGQGSASFSQPLSTSSSSLPKPFSQASSQPSTANSRLYGATSSVTASVPSSTSSHTSSFTPFGQSTFQASSSTTSSVGFFSRPIPPSTQTSSFAQPIASAATPSPLPTLFGKPVSSASSSTSSSSSLAAPTLFGKPTGSTNPSSFSATSQSGIQMSQIMKEENPKEKYGFGSKQEQFPNATGTSSFPPRSSGSTMFGGKGNNSDVKKEPAVLFGKPRKQDNESKQPEQHQAGRLFGKGADRQFGDSKDDGLFEKPSDIKPVTQTLFQKKSQIDEGQEEEKNTGRIGEPEQTGSGSENRGRIQKTRLRRLSTSTETKSPTARGLFGKSETQDGKKEGKQSLGRQISEKVAGRVAIICKNVPSRFNSNILLRDHFEQFGRVRKVFPNPNKLQATVHFYTHEEAAEAKRYGHTLAKDEPRIAIFWSTYEKKPKSPNASEPKSLWAKGKRNEPSSGVPKKRPWKAADGLDDELASMSGTQDLAPGPNTGESDLPLPGRFAKKPERKARSLSPLPAPSSMKPGEKITRSMFEGVIAHTAAERVNVLNLRDKYIRLYQKKKTKSDIATRAFLGTCPDMCPEKERYYREDTRRLHPFEIIQGTENVPGKNPQVDHRKAVKEYLRSSPDQDEPLSHELRPLPTLQNTMTYLLKEVVSKGEDGRWGDWFDYLWNRTRGIRKDITQQQLCDRGAADLIEKCARFHIFCSERLCEEDMHAFDAKINNENLTKCLQTLREFYADLEKKHKLFCTSEAEFRAYMILMNLNQGDILREVQQLRPQVRSSQEIKFALQVYFSLNNNNYIRFFRLLNQASFANACIMHRYFTQVRNKALQTMMKGYRGRAASQIPLSELVRLLSFENEQEAGEFCSYYGFPVANGEVTLDRADYIEPEKAWEPRRSIKIIEAKLHVTVGEMIYGSAFPDDVDFQTPDSSFDAAGRFHSLIPLPGADTAAGSKVSAKLPVPAAPPTIVIQQGGPAPSVTQEVKPQPKPRFTHDSVKDMARILFGEVIDEICLNIGNEVMYDVEDKLKWSNAYMDSTIQQILSEEIREISETIIAEAEEKKKEELAKEKEERKERVATVLSEEIVEDVLFQQVQFLAQDQMSEVKEELRKASEMRSSAVLSKELTEEVVSAMISQVAEDVFDVEVRQRIKQLNEFESIIKLARAGRFLERWKKEYKAVTKLKRAMEDFPSAPNMAGIQSTLDDMISATDTRVADGQFYITKRARLTVESAYELSKRRKMTENIVTVNMLYQKMLRQVAWKPLDITRIVGRSMLEKWHQNVAVQRKYSSVPSIYWKLLISLPEAGDPNDPDEMTTKYLSDWLVTKFSKGMIPRAQTCAKTKAISVYRCPLSPLSDKPLRRVPSKLGICVRTIAGSLSEDDIEEIQEERHFLGTSGLLFLMPAVAQLSQADSVFWLECKERLQGILEVKPVCQNLPLVIVVSTNEEVSYLDLLQHLSLDDLIDSNIIGNVHFVVLKMKPDHPKGIDVVDPTISEKVCEGIKWLGEQSVIPRPLTVWYLKDCIEEGLLRFYHTPVQQNLKERKLLGHLDKDPYSLIELYNSVIHHIATVLTADPLATMSWPVAEFWRETMADLPPAHWNSEDHFEYLYTFVTSLKLPEYQPANPESEQWADAQTDIWRFAASVAGSSHGTTKVDFYSRLRNLLHQVEVDFEETCYLVEGEEKCEPSYINIPWSRLVSLCIDFRLRTGDFTDPDLISMQSNVDLTEMKVAYQSEMMDDFKPPVSWQCAESEKSILDTPSLDVTIQKAADKMRLQLTLNNPSMKNEVSIVEPDIVSTVRSETKKKSSQLLNSLSTQRRHSERFLKFLESAASEDHVTLSDESMSGTMHGSDNTFTSTNRDFSMITNQRRLSFDATSYFGQVQGNISAIFDPVQTRDKEQSLHSSESKRHSLDGRSLQSTESQRQSLEELSYLPGAKRLRRISDLFGDDPVMMCLKKATMREDMQLLKSQLKSTRRKSDLFEKKLRQALASDIV